MPGKQHRKGICCFLIFFEKKQKRFFLRKLKSVQNLKCHWIDRKKCHFDCQSSGNAGKKLQFDRAFQ